MNLPFGWSTHILQARCFQATSVISHRRKIQGAVRGWLTQPLFITRLTKVAGEHGAVGLETDPRLPIRLHISGVSCRHPDAVFLWLKGEVSWCAPRISTASVFVSFSCQRFCTSALDLVCQPRMIECYAATRLSKINSSQPISFRVRRRKRSAEVPAIALMFYGYAWRMSSKSSFGNHVWFLGFLLRSWASIKAVSAWFKISATILSLSVVGLFPISAHLWKFVLYELKGINFC